MKKLRIGLEVCAGLLAVLALVGVVDLYSAVTYHNETVVWNFVNGIKIAGVSLSQDGLTTLANGSSIDDAQGAGTFTLGRTTAGTVTITAKDNDANAALSIAPGGTGNLTLGGASSGTVRVNSGTNGTITLGRTDTGTVTVTAADDDSTAALTVKPGGAAAMVVGGASMTSLTVTTDGTGTGEVVLPAAAVDAAEIGAGFVKVTFCGQNDENGVIYFAPTPITSAEPALADATCDANDNATEATADAPVATNVALYPKFMSCTTNATLGASETLVFQLRSATADVTGVTCSLATGETACDVATPTAGAVAAGATVAMKVTQSSNNADDDSKCVVLFGVK